MGPSSAPIILARLPPPTLSSTERGPLVAPSTKGVRDDADHDLEPREHCGAEDPRRAGGGRKPSVVLRGESHHIRSVQGSIFSEAGCVVGRDGVKSVTDERWTQFVGRGTLVVMEGLQFSTNAESVLYRACGGDLINMSTLPKAKLAREAEIRQIQLFTSCKRLSAPLHRDGLQLMAARRVGRRRARCAPDTGAERRDGAACCRGALRSAVPLLSFHVQAAFRLHRYYTAFYLFTSTCTCFSPIIRRLSFRYHVRSKFRNINKRA